MALPAPFRLLARRSLCLWAFMAIGVSLLALGVAYGSQWFGGLHPCHMCYLQRIPYALVILLGIAAFALPSPKAKAGLLWLCVLAFVAGAGLAGFHAGVEWHWWQGPTTCSGGIDASMSTEEILAQLRNAAVVSCSEAALRIGGLSMAGWNAPYSLGCAIVLAIGLKTRA